MNLEQQYNTNAIAYKRKVQSVRFLIFTAVVLTFFMRPFALGLNNSILSTLTLLIVSALISISVPANLHKSGKVLLLFLSFYSINIVSVSILGSFDITNLVSLGQVVMVYLLFRNQDVMLLFFKYLKNIFLLLVFLGIINFILEDISNPDKLIWLKDIQYYNGVYEFSLYYPFSWSRMHWFIPDGFPFAGDHIRQYYFFIEPGMVPTFFVATMYIILGTPDEKHKIPKIVLLLLGSLLTFSLGGVVIFFGSVVAYVLLSSKSNGKKWLFLKILIAIAMVGVTWYAYNYMPVFGKQYRMETSSVAAESIETHESVGKYIIASVAILWILAFCLSKYKKNKTISLTIAFVIGLGYLSNYVGFTTLATMFLFWDNKPMEVAKVYKKKKKLLNYNSY